MDDLKKALAHPCPGCKVEAGRGCVDIETGAEVTGVHQNRIYRAYVVAEADAHNRAVELAAEVERMRVLVETAVHYVNCPDSEAQTGEPWDALVHAVRVYEKEKL